MDLFHSFSLLNKWFIFIFINSLSIKTNVAVVCGWRGKKASNQSALILNFKFIFYSKVDVIFLLHVDFKIKKTAKWCLFKRVKGYPYVKECMLSILKYAYLQKRMLILSDISIFSYYLCQIYHLSNTSSVYFSFSNKCTNVRSFHAL